MQKATTSQLTSFSKQIRRMAKDQRLMATHVSLFTALFTCYQQNGFESPFTITRKILMAFSKIASIATYHKCIKELDDLNYINYRPSFHPKMGSHVYWPDTALEKA